MMQRRQIELYGGIGGVRDLGLLESALAMPPSMFEGEFLHKDVFEMAAAYLYHLVKNDPFLDGNKRVGAVAATVFLSINGFDYIDTPPHFADMVLAVAVNQMDKPAIADHFRRHSRKK